MINIFRKRQNRNSKTKTRDQSPPHSVQNVIGASPSTEPVGAGNLSLPVHRASLADQVSNRDGTFVGRVALGISVETDEPSENGSAATYRRENPSVRSETETTESRSSLGSERFNAEEFSKTRPRPEQVGTRRRFAEDTADTPRFQHHPAESFLRDVSDPARLRQEPGTSLWKAFTPSKPRRWIGTFAGRRWAMKRAIAAIEEEHASIVIFGPRGIGKTSLANVIAESASDAGYQVLRCPCSSDITFEEIFRSFLRNLPADFMERSDRAKNPSISHFEELLPQGKFGSTEVTMALGQLKMEHVIFIIDEFDRIISNELKVRLAETIKNLSDISARVTFVIVGISRTLEELMGIHPSIQRHVVGIHLHLMDRAELNAVIRLGEEASGIRFDDATRDTIVSFSKGLPYCTQLMCLNAGRAALAGGSVIVNMANLRAALEEVLRDADPNLVAAYEVGTGDGQKSLQSDVLFAAANCRSDKFGGFTAGHVRDYLAKHLARDMKNIAVHRVLTELSSNRTASIFVKFETAGGIKKYAFNNPAMRNYIVLRQAPLRDLI